MAEKEQREKAAEAAQPAAQAPPPTEEKKNRPEGALARWRRLNQDKRPFKRRLLVAGAPVAALLFTLLIAGPFEMVVRNQDYIDLKLADILVPFLILFLTTTALLTGILMLCRGKLLDILSSLVLGLALACYVQGAFLNLPLGTLTGEAVPWHSYAGHSLLNAAVWACLVALPLVLRYFWPRIWHGALPLAALVLAAMQLVGLAVLLPAAKGPNAPYYLSGANRYQVAAGENTVVFILDAFCTKDMEDVLAQWPDALNSFSDFTYFQNHSGTINGTFYALATLLTGHDYDYSKPYQAFLDEAWTSENCQDVYGALREAGYATRIYTDPAFLVANTDMLAGGLVENVRMGQRQLRSGAIMRQMLKLSAYRYAPHGFKANFWMDTSAFYDLVMYADSVEDAVWVHEDVTFYQQMMERGLELWPQGDKLFQVHHLRGPHDPHIMNELAQPDENATRVQQAKGNLYIVEEYLRQMKALGVYDNANIIITSDHGYGYYQAPLLMVKRSGESHPEMVTSQAPVCHADFLPTVLQMAGVEDYGRFGRSYFDVAEDEERERVTYMWMQVDIYPPGNGSVNAVAEYRFTEHIETLNYGEYSRLIPLVDSYY